VVWVLLGGGGGVAPAAPRLFWVWWGGGGGGGGGGVGWGGSPPPSPPPSPCPPPPVPNKVVETGLAVGWGLVGGEKVSSKNLGEDEPVGFVVLSSPRPSFVVFCLCVFWLGVGWWGCLGGLCLVGRRAAWVKKRGAPPPRGGGVGGGGGGGVGWGGGFVGFWEGGAPPPAPPALGKVVVGVLLVGGVFRPGGRKTGVLDSKGVFVVLETSPAVPRPVPPPPPEKRKRRGGQKKKKEKK